MGSRYVFAVVVAAACGRNAAPPSPSPPPVASGAVVSMPAPPPAAGSGRDVRRPCTMITAAEVAGIVGFNVTVQDDGFRCKFVDAKQGWLQLELMESTSRSAAEICGYAPDKRTIVPGVGDSASYLGATACVKLGDVAIIVDGANLAARSDALGRSGAQNPYILVAKLVAPRIP